MGVSRRTKERELKKNLIAVAIVLVFALIVFSFNSIGKFIAENLIVPLVAIGTTDSSATVTEKISLKKVEAFILGTHFYATQEECADAVSLVKKQGGAGYLLAYEQGYYVVHSCYADNESAKKQLNELVKAFDGTQILSLYVDELSIKVTGTKAQTEVIKEGFEFLSEAVSRIADISLSSQEKSYTPLEACTKLQGLKSELESNQKALENFKSGNSTVNALKDMYSCTKTLFNELPQSSDEAFLQKLNYAATAYACEYIKFCSELE